MQAPIQPAQLELYLGAYRLSRLLHAATGLGLVAAMAEGPRDLDGLASRTRTHPGTLRAVLDALSAWGVFAREAEDRYALTPVSRRLLPGEPGGIDPLLVTGWVGHPADGECRRQVARRELADLGQAIVSPAGGGMGDSFTAPRPAPG